MTHSNTEWVIWYEGFWCYLPAVSQLVVERDQTAPGTSRHKLISELDGDTGLISSVKRYNAVHGPGSSAHRSSCLVIV